MNCRGPESFSIYPCLIMFFLLISHLTYRCNISFLIICNLFNEGNSIITWVHRGKQGWQQWHTYRFKTIELKLNNNLLLLSSSIDHLLVKSLTSFQCKETTKLFNTGQHICSGSWTTIMPLPSTVQMSGSWTFVVGLPAVSARYPIRLKEPKPLTDQEAGELMSLF